MKQLYLGVLGGLIAIGLVVVAGLVALWLSQPRPPPGTPAGYVCVETFKEAGQRGEIKGDKVQYWVPLGEARFATARGTPFNPNLQVAWPCGRPGTSY